MEKYSIGIDLGGTKISGVLLNRGYTLVKKARVDTGNTEKGEEIIQKILNMVKEFRNNYEITSIGIGCAGLINEREGIVQSSPNIKFLNNYHLAPEIEQKTGLKTFVDNDVKAGAVSELFIGEGKDVSDFVLITLGTGIGSTIVINRRIVRGHNNLAGEVGHLTLVEDGYLCGCGKRGCFETLSSGPAIKRYFLKRISEGESSKIMETVAGNPELIDVPLITQFAEDGDRLSLEAIEYSLHFITLVTSYFINLLNPQKIIFGGGLTKGLAPFFDRIYDNLPLYALDIPLNNVKIVKSDIEEGIATGAAIYGFMKARGEEI